MREERMQRTRKLRAKTRERSFSDSSPCEETRTAWSTSTPNFDARSGRLNSSHLIGAAILLRALYDFWFLVALVDLHADAGRGRWNHGLNGLRERVVNGGLHGGWNRKSPVQTSGIGGWNFVLLGIERIAQRELDVSFGTGQSEPLSVVGRNQQRDHGRGLGLTCRGSFQGVAGGEHGDILQNRRGLLFAARARRSRQQDIDACSRRYEPGDGYDFIHPHRNRAHAGRD